MESKESYGSPPEGAQRAKDAYEYLTESVKLLDAHYRAYLKGPNQTAPCRTRIASLAKDLADAATALRRALLAPEVTVTTDADGLVTGTVRRQ